MSRGCDGDHSEFSSCSSCLRGSLRSLTVGTALLSALLSGCNSDIVPVSGRVTLDGQPLANAVVTFQPIRDSSAEPPTATGSVGQTDAEGRYVLRLVDPDIAGALVGEHVVTISTAMTSAVEGEPPGGERLPEAWLDGSQRYTVPASGTVEANFDVVTDSAPAKSPSKRKK
jgi:hypothetical protein